MSIKSHVFNALMGGLPPANKFNFLVIIPGIMPIVGLASTFNFISQQIPSHEVIVKGKMFHMPLLTEDSAGILYISFYETSGFSVREALHNKMAGAQYQSKVPYFDIDLITLSLDEIPNSFTKYTHCWLSGRADVALESSAAEDPVQWNAKFFFNGIKEIPVAPGVSSYASILAQIAVITGEKLGIKTKNTVRGIVT